MITSLYGSDYICSRKRLYRFRIAFTGDFTADPKNVQISFQKVGSSKKVLNMHETQKFAQNCRFEEAITEEIPFFGADLEPIQSRLKCMYYFTKVCIIYMNKYTGDTRPIQP